LLSHTSSNLCLIQFVQDNSGRQSRAGSPPWQIEDEADELPDGSSPHTSPSPNTDAEHSPAAENSDTGDDSSDIEIPIPPTPEVCGGKRKSMADSISEIATAERGNRLEIATIQAKAKTERSIKKERIKRKMNLEMERTRLEHHRQEANAQHAHEAAMFDRQLALEAMKAGGPMSNIHPDFR
jgi:hypothetical protein